MSVTWNRPIAIINLNSDITNFELLISTIYLFELAILLQMLISAIRIIVFIDILLISLIRIANINI